MYKALDIANYVINKEGQMGHSVSNLKLQKILYFIQAEFLVVKGIPCFEEEIIAWGFGPVVLEVYHEYKVYGAAGIPVFFKKKNPYILKEDKILINNILDDVREYSSSTLTNITLCQTPWKESYVPKQDRPIRRKLIKEYFTD